MGTIVSAKLYAADEKTAAGFADAFEAKVAEYEKLFTVHGDGPLNEVNKNAGQWVPVDCRIAALVQTAKTIAQKSDRAFEPTIGTLVNVWKIGFGGDKHPKQEDIKKALEKVGLGGREGENFLSLSGGERQLCLLARALVQKSAFLVLDEPDSSLDVKNKVAVLSALRQSAAREGRGVLIAMHDVSSALRFCDRIALLQDGKILSCFSPRECSEEEISLTLSRVYGTIAVSEMTLNGERCYAVAVGEA